MTANLRAPSLLPVSFLLCALALQALPADWIPERPIAPAAADAAPDYLEAVAALAREADWPWERIEALRAGDPARAAALASWLPRADRAAQKLAALLAAGCAGPLAHEVWRLGLQSEDEALAVACLLAPAAPPPEWWPALAHRALARAAPLPVRAAAAARLLEADCWGAWPLARSILRTGTDLDEPAPWADWTRGGRYELPKRLLTAALDLRFARAGQSPSGFEPNAAWKDQEECLRRLEPLAQELRRAAAQPAVQELAPWQAMLRQAADDPQAADVLALLAGEALPLLRAALGAGDPSLAWTARRALERHPR